MAIDYDKLASTSLVNYLKRSSASGSGNLPVNSSLPIDHGLGIIPQYDIFVDLFNDGTFWYGGDYVDKGTESTSSGFSDAITVDSWVTTSQLIINASDYTSGASGTRPVYFVIYQDYGG